MRTKVEAQAFGAKKSLSLVRVEKDGQEFAGVKMPLLLIETKEKLLFLMRAYKVEAKVLLLVIKLLKLQQKL